MRTLIFTLVLSVFSALRLFSQEHDVQWVQGTGPVSRMDFREDSIAFHFITNDDSTTLFVAAANICDKQGNFLFFTNGISVLDRYGKRMLNGDSLSYNDRGVWLGMDFGAPNDQAVMILPKPGSDHLYYIFHFIPGDTFFSVYGKPILGYPTPSIGYSLPLSLYYSLIDMNANFGLGEVVEKNVRIWRGLACASKMTSVKHANGRDWWIIRHGWRDNTYIKFLLTPDTILGPYIQNIGPAYEQNNIAIDYYGTSVFNQQGTQMASVNGYSPTVVLDFDRCSGEFSNPLVIQNRLADTTILGGMGLAFSPNGRFLYVNTMYLLNQYDLWSATPNDSVELYKVDSTDWFYMHQQRLGPNGKIYISTYHGGTSHLHVINNPDSLGLACGFEFNGQECMTLNTSKLPNMVNYKLGPLVGSGCDTVALVSGVGGWIADGFKVSVSPNPASNIVDITIKHSQEDLLLSIYNQLGELIGNAEVNNYVELNVSDFATGIYFLKFTGSEGLINTQKLIVTR